LEIPTRIIIALDSNPTLKFFSHKFIQPYLFGFLYYQKYGKFPFGDNQHGAIGLLDYYRTIFSVNSINAACKLLGLVFYDFYDKYQICPCESGQYYEKCHRQQIENMKTNGFVKHYRLDFSYIATWLFPSSIRHNKNNLRNRRKLCN